MVFKVNRFQNPEACFLTYGPWSQLTSALAKHKTNKMVFSTEDLVLVKALRQEEGYVD